MVAKRRRAVAGAKVGKGKKKTFYLLNPKKPSEPLMTCQNKFARQAAQKAATAIDRGSSGKQKIPNMKGVWLHEKGTDKIHVFDFKVETKLEKKIPRIDKATGKKTRVDGVKLRKAYVNKVGRSKPNGGKRDGRAGIVSLVVLEEEGCDKAYKGYPC
jgi:hypothetical protein